MYTELILIGLILGIIMYLIFLSINLFLKNWKKSMLVIIILTIVIFFSGIYLFADRDWLLAGYILLSPIPILSGIVALVLGWIVNLSKGNKHGSKKEWFFLTLGFRRLLEGLILIFVVLSFSMTKPSNFREALQYKGAYVKGETVAGALNIRTGHTDYRPELLKPVYYHNEDIPAVSEFSEEDFDKLTFRLAYQPKAKYTLHPLIFEMEDLNSIRRIASQRNNFLGAIRFEKWKPVHVSFFKTGKEREEELRGNEVTDTLLDKQTRIFYLMVDGKYIVEDFSMEKIVMLKGYLKLSYDEIIYQIAYYSLLFIILISIVELTVFIIRKRWFNPTT